MKKWMVFLIFFVVIISKSVSQVVVRDSVEISTIPKNSKLLKSNLTEESNGWSTYYYSIYREFNPNTCELWTEEVRSTTNTLSNGFFYSKEKYTVNGVIHVDVQSVTPAFGFSCNSGEIINIRMFINNCRTPYYLTSWCYQNRAVYDESIPCFINDHIEYHNYMDYSLQPVAIPSNIYARKWNMDWTFQTPALSEELIFLFSPTYPSSWYNPSTVWDYSTNAIEVNNSTYLIKWINKDGIAEVGIKVMINWEETIYWYNVEVTPDSIRHNKEATVTIHAEDENGLDFTVPDDTPLDLSIEEYGSGYGTLVAPNGTRGKVLKGISYLDARTGKVKYIASNMIQTEEQEVYISVEQVTDDKIPWGKGLGYVKLLSEKQLQNYIVTFEPEEIKYSESSIVHVQAIAENGENFDPPAGTKLNFTLDANGQRYGSLRLPDSTKLEPETMVLYTDIQAGMVNYIADGVTPVGYQRVTVAIVDANNSTMAGSGTLTVVPDRAHFQVTVIPDTVKHKNQSIIKVQAKDKENKNVDVSPGTNLHFSLDTAGVKYGSLRLADGTKVEPWMDIDYGAANAGEVKYLADGTMPAGCQRVTVAVVDANNSTMAGSGTLTVVPGMDHFQVTMIPDTVKHKNQSIIKVQAKDKENKNVDVSPGTNLHFSLDTAGVNYGKLSYDNIKSDEMNSIPYTDAESGKVNYVAEGKNPINLTPREINIPVNLSDNTNINGTGKCWVHCLIEPKRYAQVSSSWSTNLYGSSGISTIGAEGCALCCEAMAMTAYGDTINPSDLNNWMRDPTRSSITEGSYAGTDLVSWYAISEHTQGKMNWYRHFARLQKLVATTNSDGSTNTTYVLNNEGSSSKTVLDDPLSKCQLVIVQVYDSNLKMAHWVLVTGKINSRYTISDPSGKNAEYLDEYGNFWTYVVVNKI